MFFGYGLEVPLRGLEFLAQISKLGCVVRQFPFSDTCARAAPGAAAPARAGLPGVIVGRRTRSVGTAFLERNDEELCIGSCYAKRAHVETDVFNMLPVVKRNAFDARRPSFVSSYFQHLAQFACQF